MPSPEDQASLERIWARVVRDLGIEIPEVPDVQDDFLEGGLEDDP